MKYLLIALFSLASIALITATTCHGDNTSTCKVEHCDDNYEVACVKNFCTCIVSKCGPRTECHSLNNCASYAHQHNCQCSHVWHCFDNHCSCGYDIPGGI